MRRTSYRFGISNDKLKDAADFLNVCETSLQLLRSFRAYRTDSFHFELTKVTKRPRFECHLQTHPPRR
jgi:hypothetical protein